ncbi:MAG: ferrochelatase [Burkholderiales bacterium]
MSAFRPEPEYEHGAQPKTGVLLVNLGTPEAPTRKALKRYLKEFLSDRYVIEIPKALWQPILRLVILNSRPRKSAQKYAQIWLPEGSPLRVHTARQAEMLRGYLGECVKSTVLVNYAMRYGAPSISAKLDQLRKERCERILLVPLFPQYSAATTGSAFAKVYEWARNVRNQPSLRFLKHYHDHPKYIAALAQSIRDYWMKTGRPAQLVMSFHGMPRRTLKLGDPYHCECQKTGRLLAEALGLEEKNYQVCFQSRFGRSEWLQPYTSEVLKELGWNKVGRVDVVCPGFVSDCLETLEEIAIEGKTVFLLAGGCEFHYIPCLNERDDWLHALTQIALENLSGWVSETKESVSRAARESKMRALARGSEK